MTMQSDTLPASARFVPAQLTPGSIEELFPEAGNVVKPEELDSVAAVAGADRASTIYKLVNLAVVVFPFIGFIAAMTLLAFVDFHWIYPTLLVALYVVSGLGITVGYHRLFTHKSFDAGPIVTWFWAVAGSTAAEGPILRWAAMHRQHHQYSDKEHDPHSPHLHEDTAWGAIKGAWHAHVGWLFQNDPANMNRYIADLQKDKVVVMVSNQFLLWLGVSFLVPAVIAGLVTGSWLGALMGFLWGGAARIFVVHHITWSINSVCHLWGARPFNSHDHSRNNIIFGIIGFGEGWHNNHHAFPASARHGLMWWQIDTSYMVIRGMEMLGLAKRIRVPSPERIASKAREQ
jgi:stearoyl-CoA desaturase (delta-9 desaturase)